MQTKYQKAYGIRRTLADKLERQARAIRAGDFDRFQKLVDQEDRWAERKIRELIDA